jgi:hypothetical protein
VLPQDLPTRAICPRFTSKNINQLFNLSRENLHIGAACLMLLCDVRRD